MSKTLITIIATVAGTALLGGIGFLVGWMKDLSKRQGHIETLIQTMITKFDTYIATHENTHAEHRNTHNINK